MLRGRGRRRRSTSGPCGDDAPGGQLAGGGHALGVGVAGGQLAGAPGGVGEREERLAVGRLRVDPAGEAERLLERLDAQPQAVGEHATDLGERAVGLDAEALSFLGRTAQTKHYGIASRGAAPDPALAAAVRELAEPGDPGFTIAHDAKSAGLGRVY